MTDCVDEVFLPQSIYILLALYKFFVKFELKLLKKSMVLPTSLRPVSLFVLLGLNTSEAKPIAHYASRASVVVLVFTGARRLLIGERCA